MDGTAQGAITGNVITGAGSTPLIAQNGIQVGFGAGPVSISGNTITFTTPMHTAFKTAFTAQLSRYLQWTNGPLAPVVKYAQLYVRVGSWNNPKKSSERS